MKKKMNWIRPSCLLMCHTTRKNFKVVDCGVVAIGVFSVKV